MCLNQILQNEQVTLMRHAAADNMAKTRPLRRKLNMFQRLLQEHPYAHRPYAPANPSERPSASDISQSSGSIPALASWENEGGHLEVAESQKRSNREIRKPKAETLPASQVGGLMKKPKGKL